MNNISVTPKGGTIATESSGNQITLTAPSLVKLHLSQSDIKSFTRNGNDLVVTTKSGEVLVIHNFYGPNGDSDLVLQDNQGALWWVEDPGSEGFHYVSIDSTDAILAEGSSGNVATTAAYGIAGGALLAGLIALAGGGGGGHGDNDGNSGGNNGGGNNGGGNNGGGNNGGGDTTAPGAATNLLISDNVGAQQGAITNGTSTDDNTPTLSGNAEAGSTVNIYDGGTLLGTATVAANGTWSFTSPALTDGQHSLSVTVTDAAGNTSAATDAVTFTVDTVPPVAAGDLQLSNDGVPIAPGSSTNDTTPTLSGTAEPGSTVTISDGGTVIGTVTVGNDGTWNYTTPTLGDGDHSITTTVTDPAGNTSPSSDPINFTVDTSIPAAATGLVVTDNVGETQGPLASGAITDDSTPTLSGQAEAGSTVNVYDGTTLLGSATVGADGNWSFTSPALADGQHSLTVTVTDAAGNTSAATSPFTLTTDTVAPAAVGDLVVTNNDGATPVPIAQDGATNDSTPVLTGTGEAGSTITITDGTTVLGTVTVGSDGNWSFTSPTLADGSHTLSITATDAAGNVSPATTFTVNIDTVAPAATTGLTVTDDVGAVQGPLTSGATTDDSTPTLSGQAEAGTTVSVYDGTTLLGTTTVAADGSWSFTSPTLSNGDHSLTTTVTDAAGNVSPASPAFDLTVDAGLPPATSSLQVTDDTGTTLVQLADGASTHDNTPTLSGLAGANNTVTLYNGDVLLGTVIADADGQWVFDTSTLPDGTYVFHAVATDAGGNAADSGNITIIIDTVAPATAGDLQLNNDNGSSVVPIASGGATNDSTPVFSGTAEPGSTVTISDGTTVLGTVTVGSDGTWSYTTPTLTEGDHSLTTTVTDAAGNTSPASDPITFTVDTTAPAAATGLVVTDDVGDSTGALASGDTTDDSTPTLSGQAEAGTTVSVYDGTTLLGTTTVAADGSWSFTSPTLGNGDHSLTTTVTDAAGNVSPASPAFDLTVDAGLPPATSSLQVTDDTGTTLVQLADGASTHDNTPTLSGLAGANDTVTLYNGDVLLGTVIADADGQWVFDTSTLPDGTYVFHALATDAVGNTADSGNITIIIDTVAPDAAGDLQLNNNEGSSVVPIVSGDATNDSTPVFSGTAEPGSTVTITDGTTVLGTVTVGSDGTWSYTTPTLTEGDHSLTTTVTDAAGNTSPASDPITFTVDTTAPAAATGLVVTDDVGDSTGALASGDTTDDSTPTLSGQAEAGTTVSVYDGTTLLGTTTVAADGSWSFTSPTLSNGDHSLTTTVTDAAGNVSPVSPAFDLTVDAGLPPATSSLQVTDDTGTTLVQLADGASTHDNTPTLSGVAGANDTVTLYNGDVLLGTVIADADGQWVFDTSTLPDGTYVFHALATDAAGNTADSGNITIIIDTVAPDAAGDLQLNNNEGSTLVPIVSGDATNDNTPVFSGTAEPGSTVTITDGTTVLGTVTVGSDGTWSYTTPTLTEGDHSLTTTVTDAAGNSSPASTPITFSVDTVPPSTASNLQLSNDQTGTLVPITDGATNDTTPVLSGFAEPGSTVTISDGATVLGTTTVATDGTWSYTTPTLAEGDHSLTAVVTDAAGNSSAATAPLPVTVDTIAPVAATDLLLSNDQSGTAVPITDGTTNDSSPLLSGNAEPGSTITVSDGTTVLGTATAAADGSWSYSIPALSEGDHSLTTTVTDAAGNVSPATDPIAIIIDITPPAAAGTALSNDAGVAILDGGATNDTTPLLTGSSEAGSTVTVLDGTTVLGTVTAGPDGSWTFTVPALGEGPHSISTTVSDAAGNNSVASIPISFEVDTTAPAAATDLVLSNDQSGTIVPIDNGITNDTTPVLSGSAEPGSTVTVSNGTEVLGTANVGADGTWTFTPTTPLPEGPYSLTTTVTDPAGNVSDPSAAVVFTVDTTAPNAATGVELNNDEGATPVAINDNGATNDTTPVLSGSADVGSTVTVYDGTTVLGTAAVGADGTWSFTTPTLSEGAHSLTATVTDAAGNESDPSTAISFTVDTTPPAAADGLVLSNDQGTTPVIITNGTTNDTTPVLSGTAEAGSTVTVSEGTNVLGTATVGADGSWSFTVPALAEGAHSLTTTVTDAAGNTSLPSTPVSVTVDTTPPSAAADVQLDNNEGSALVPIAAGSSTNDSTPVLSGGANSAEPGSTVTVSDGTTVLGTTTVAADGSWSFTTPVLATGDHSLSAVVTDPAGNSSAATPPIAFTVDTTAPDAAQDLLLSNDTSGTPVAIDEGGITNDSTPVLSGTAEANSVITVLDGTTVLGTTTADATGAWSFTPTLTDGDHSLTVTATDAAGNTGVASAAVTVTVDTVAPTVTDLALTNDSGTTPVAIADGALTNDNSPVISGAAEAGSTVTISDGTNVLALLTVDASGIWSYTLTTALTDGPHTLSVTATDIAGNISAPATISLVVDATPPDAATGLILSTDDGTPVVTNTSGTFTSDDTPIISGAATAGEVINIYNGTELLGTTTVGSDGQWTFTLPPLSDATYTLSVQVADAAGNLSPTTAITFTVDTTVPAPATLEVFNNDGTAEVAIGNGGTTNDNTPLVSGTAEAGSLVTLYDGNNQVIGTVIASDAGTWSFQAPQLSDGTHSVTATVTDELGNVSTATPLFTITVDTTAPEPVSDLLLQNNNGPALVDIANGGTTNDSTPLLSGTAEAGSTVSIYNVATGALIGTVDADATTGAWSFTPTTGLPEGTYTVGVTVTDAAGNASAGSTLSFTIDLTPPAEVATFNIYNNDGASPVLIANGGDTNDDTPVLRGTATAGTTVNIYEDGALIGQATVSDTGVWRFQTSTLPDATHTFNVSVVDAAGNESAQSANYVITVDTVVPDPVATLEVTDNVGDLQGLLATGDTTDDSTPTFSGTAEAGTTVNIYEGTTLLGTATVATDGSWSITPAALGNGIHDFTISVTDGAGNVSTSTDYTLTIDAGVPPATTTLEITDDAGTTLVTLNNGDSTNDSTPVLSGLSTAGATITVFDGLGNIIGSVIVGTDNQWSFTPPVLADGPHDFFVTTTDLTGNTTTSDTISITIDTVAPDAVTDLTASNDRSGTPVAIADGGITNDNTPLLTGTAEPGGLVTVYDGNTVLGTTTADATTGAWSFNTPVITSGGHALSVTVTDEAGNISARSTAVTLTVDTLAPAAATLIVTDDLDNTVVANGGSTNDATPTLSGSAEAGSLVTVYDGTTILGTTTATAGGSWSFTTAALTEGSHSFTVRATDAAGNQSIASSTTTVIVDTIAPAAVTLTVSNNNGTTAIIIPDNGSTNDNTPALNGTAEAGSLVTISEGNNVLGTVTASSTGTWSFVSPALADGTHTLSVTATDAAGNVSVATTDTFTIVTSGPTPVTDLTVTDNVGTIIGALVSGAVTDDTTPTLAGTAGAAGNLVTIYDGTTVLGTVTAGAGGAWSFTPAALANGSHPLSVTVTDTAGNVSAATNFPITVDTVAPTASTLVITNDVTGTVVPGGGSTNDTTPTLSGVAEAGSTVKIYDNGALIGTTTAAANGTWAFTTDVLATGSHPLTVTATDAAGNVGAATAATVIIDTTAPAAVTLTASNNNGTTPVAIANNGSTNDSTPALSGTAEAGSTVTISEGTTVLGTVTAAANGTWSFTTATLPNGPHTFSATATDTAGNVSTPTTLTLTVDTVAPVASSLVVTNDNVTPNVTVPNGGSTNDSTPTLSGLAEANATVKVYDGTTLLGTTTANSAGAWSFTTSTLSNGTHPLNVTVTDAAGNTSPLSSTVSIIVDTVAPATSTLVITNDVTGTVVPGGGSTNDTTPTLSGVAEAGSTVKIYDNGALIGTTTAAANGTWAFTTDVLATGSHPLTVTATDAAGNVGAATAATVIIDTTAPAAVTLTASNNNGTTPVAIANNGSTNDSTPALSGTAEAGSTVTISEGTTVLGTVTAAANGTWSFTTATLPNGPHTFSATATDAAGNVSTPTTLTLTVDTVAPTPITDLTVSDNVGATQGQLTSGSYTDDKTPTLAGTAEANALVTIYDGTTVLGTTNASGTGAWSFTPTGLSDGTHALSVTATDAAGNTSAASSAVSITVDTIAPSAVSALAINSAGTTLTGTGEANATVTVKDADGNTIGSGTVASNGNFTITLTTTENTGATLSVTQTDLAGNVSPGASVVGAISVVATNDTATLDYTSTEGTITNPNTSSTHTALLNVGLGGLLTASVLTNGNSYQFSVGNDDTRTVTLHATLGGVSLLADYSLYLYEQQTNGSWALVQTTPGYLHTGIISIGTQQGANVTYTNLGTGTYAVVLGSPLNVALFPSTTITTVSDITTLAVTVAATVTGNLLENDTSSVAGTIPVGAAVTEISTSAVATSGNTVITTAYGTLTVDAQGDYTYVLKAGLDIDTLPTTETFNYSVRDANGNQTSATLTVDLHEGVSTSLATNSLLATATETTASDASGSIYADSNALHSGTLSITNEHGDTTTVNSTGTTLVTGDYGVLSIAANGSYTYALSADTSVQNITHKEVFSYSLAASDGTLTHNSFTIELNPTITGTAGDDHLTSSAYDDTITAGAGADTLVYHLLASADATGGNGHDTWTDFNVAQGDKIDVSNLLIGWNDATSNVNDFVKVDHTSEGNTVLSIDRDGTGTAYSSTALVTLEGVNVSLEELLQQPHQNTTA